MATAPKHLKDLLNLPTAPFCEQHVLGYIANRCEKLPNVRTRRDEHDNLIVHYRHDPPDVAPLVFAAHTDHPGFCAQQMVGKRRLRAEFRGGVLADFFPGAKVRFWDPEDNNRKVNSGVRGKVVEVTKTQTRKRRGSMRVPTEVLVDVPREVAPQSIGMWDLPDATVDGDLIRARACDDIVGCAGMLDLLMRLSKKKARADVMCLFTRAEEVGFVGAIAAVRSKVLPKKRPIVAIEISSVLPGVEQGAGPILRVGDRTAVFTPELTNFCDRVALDMQQKRKNFRFQRKLMDGGTCESSAYIAYGYAATGICLALGNYHNMDRKRGRIAAEYIHLNDYKLLVDWFEALVLDEPGYGGEQERMRQDMEQRFQKLAPILAEPLRA